MKHLKLFSLVVMSAGVLMVVSAGSASATTLTGSGGATLGTETAVSASSEGGIVIHESVGDTECKEINLGGKISNAGGATETVKVGLETVTFTSCNSTVSVLRKGTLEFHTAEAGANNNGILTWTGGEWTTEFSGIHCIFGTNATKLGTVTGSATTGGNATLDVEATIARIGGRSGSFCGSTVKWTGAFKFTSPSVLNVD